MFIMETRQDPKTGRWVVYEDGRELRSWTYSSKSSARRAIKRHIARAQDFRCSCCRESLLKLEAAGGLCPIDALGNCGLRQRHPERKHPNLLTIACMNTLSSSRWYVVNEKKQDCEVVQQAIPVIRRALLNALEVQR